ncbi:hypothetical protein Aca07nite_88570 [Actinoplanes capillaceus]|uniref:Uncharacterized protein n=1 Tax=Actinoplanes campanulatus TaxID=113559 RepID=A0ABQ3WZ74_9ACTN|nr:hypothetical protein Aca07nite_88570 [Actinoplanes capillaceus]
MPPSMIESATARRVAGDWAGACAAAHVDVDLNLRAVGRAHGRGFAAMIRADLRRMAPDLLRWHLPRVAPDGLLRPGLTMTLARYPGAAVHLVARTAPGWAAGGQRISLAVWEPRSRDPGPHPRARPDRRFRLDLHPHLWAADQAAELRERCGSDGWRPAPEGYAAHRWEAEAAILRAAEGRDGPVTVRLGGGRRLILGEDRPRRADRAGDPAGMVLPWAATWVLPDLELLHAGLITPDRLHPLVAAALAPGRSGAHYPTTTAPTPDQAGEHCPTTTAPTPDQAGASRPVIAMLTPGRSGIPGPAGTNAGGREGERLVECRGEVHRLGLVDGALRPLDHGEEELRREEILRRLGGPQLPCLAAITGQGRRPAFLDEVRNRLDHGDHDGALAVAEEHLGPEARLPEGELRDEFAAAVEERVRHGMFRAGLLSGEPGLSGKVTLGRLGRRGRDHRTPRRARHFQPATSIKR